MPFVSAQIRQGMRSCGWGQRGPRDPKHVTPKKPLQVSLPLFQGQATKDGLGGPGVPGVLGVLRLCCISRRSSRQSSGCPPKNTISDCFTKTQTSKRKRGPLRGWRRRCAVPRRERDVQHPGMQRCPKAMTVSHLANPDTRKSTAVSHFTNPNVRNRERDFQHCKFKLQIPLVGPHAANASNDPKCTIPRACECKPRKTHKTPAKPPKPPKPPNPPPPPPKQFQQARQNPPKTKTRQNPNHCSKSKKQNPPQNPAKQVNKQIPANSGHKPYTMSIWKSSSQNVLNDPEKAPKGKNNEPANPPKTFPKTAPKPPKTRQNSGHKPYTISINPTPLNPKPLTLNLKPLNPKPERGRLSAARVLRGAGPFTHPELAPGWPRFLEAFRV